MAKHHLIKNPTNYATIHSWNNSKYPKQNKCSHCYTKTAKKYEWALLHGKSHSRGIDNYIELCKRCHIKYDKTEQWTQKNLEALKKTYAHQNPIKPKECKYCKDEFTPRRKESIFCSNRCSAKNRKAPIRERDGKGKFMVSTKQKVICQRNVLNVR